MNNLNISHIKKNIMELDISEDRKKEIVDYITYFNSVVEALLEEGVSNQLIATISLKNDIAEKIKEAIKNDIPAKDFSMWLYYYIEEGNIKELSKEELVKEIAEILRSKIKDQGSSHDQHDIWNGKWK